MQDVPGILRLLCDQTRIKILKYLGDGERNVTEICRFLDSTQPGVSHHLSLMRFSLVEARRQGKNNYYCLTPFGKKALKFIGEVETFDLKAAG